MARQFIRLLTVLTLCVGLLINWTNPTKAQGSLLANGSVLGEKLKTIALVSDPNIVTWQMLGLGDANLVGPNDSFFFSFNLPADWKLIEGASLSLSLGVSVSGGIQSQADSTITAAGQPNVDRIIAAGTLTISVNDTTLLVLPVDQAGEIVRTIEIPVEAFNSVKKNGLVEVEIALNSGASCYDFDQMNVAIRTSSYFTLPHESIQPAPNLVDFPSPIYQDSFIPDSALLIIPDRPSAADLQAALTVASGLGKLSGGSLALDLVSLGKLTNEQETANHLIFVGSPTSLPVLGQFQLPLPVDKGLLQVSGSGTDDGFVEMVNSPWNKSNVVLVVSGNTDRGVIKAAQAVSTGVFQPNQFPNLAVVQEVQTTPVLTPQPTDQTLTALGYKGRSFEGRGVNNETYEFNVPPGWTVASDSSFELVFGHSALLDYGSSGIVILLNGDPIGSVRMSDASAGLSMNKVLINIPVSAVVPGKNQLEVRVNLDPQDICSPQNMAGLWAHIWPESTLHLPLDLALINPAESLSLASYPAPFTYYPLLDNTAFVLMHNDLESWRAAVTIAAFWGSEANGPVTALKVYYGDDLPVAERSKYNFLIIGRPSQMPIIDEINKNLPIPFVDGSDVLVNTNFQVTYRIPSDAPMGYLEITPSPWNSDNVILSALGNATQGLGWATSSLIDPTLRSKLTGNFAVIKDKQIITTDTRLSPTIKSEPTQVAEVVVIPPNVDTNSLSRTSTPQQAAWIFPLFVASIILIILISAFVVLGRWSRQRTRGNTQTGGNQSGQGYSSSINKWFSSFFEKTKKRKRD